MATTRVRRHCAQLVAHALFGRLKKVMRRQREAQKSRVGLHASASSGAYAGIEDQRGCVDGEVQVIADLRCTGGALRRRPWPIKHPVQAHDAKHRARSAHRQPSHANLLRQPVAIPGRVAPVRIVSGRNAQPGSYKGRLPALSAPRAVHGSRHRLVTVCCVPLCSTPSGPEPPYRTNL